MAGVTGLLATAVVWSGQATAGPQGGLGASTVRSGAARFEVLSPTLVRTEYADDGGFLDAPTFNAVGRDGFAPTPFTTTTSDGWLTLRTSALTLRYKVGSGPFSTDNLTVAVTAGDHRVTATPWRRVVCTTGALCEAEDLSYDGVTTATDHKGFTGTGFVAGFDNQGDTLTTDVDVSTAGSYTLAARYANAGGGDGKYETRTLTLSVDGTDRTLRLPTTANWDTWSVASLPVQLAAGRHSVVLKRAPTDSGQVNLDSLALLGADGGYPQPSAKAAVDCRFGTGCEAEAGRTTGSAIVAADHEHFAGQGFVAELGQGSALSAPVTGIPADGTYTLHLRYANGLGGDGRHQTRTATVAAGGAEQQVSLPATDDWDTWSTVSVPVRLKAGADTLTLRCPDATSCHVNVDTLALTRPGRPAPPAHLALGGYRRGLDGVDGDRGSVRTTPGLLHQDGWYLLDDTPSAVYDAAHRTSPGPRPDHHGRPYQDGYVFGYGHDYDQALSDLATLTGPSELLPRWAYGVWYSEYMDRTAADYRDTVLPAFRAEGVPLDVLVVDTDYKSPHTWNGWEFDRAKFPDPEGFFDWAAAQGLHTTLNIHPSILGTDPQFPAAMATAENKLKNTGCWSAPGGTPCYTFDFGDPDQLTAYLDLHRTFDRQGNDFWWLDWCCDGSRSSLHGVTPDAWINQQYATTADAAVGRGFVLSRAYGSLQTGVYSGPTGLATGPWADKRTTVHFTGDTSSTWGTLKAEVGYTPGESAATGMSAISHDIGGHNDTTGLEGSETYTVDGQTHHTKKLPDDMYARWVQLGTFQPIDRLHGAHSDRLPWQYGPAARASADKFLRLRDQLVPYTYTLAQEASTTGVPVVRPTYLEYPDEPSAYAAADTEYFYGPDLLVAPVTEPGATASTTVWFPPGRWTDYFTGKVYEGGTTQRVTADLDTMPVFVRAGGIVPTRTDAAAATSPLTRATLTIATGASGSCRLYEDDGTTALPARSARTTIRYTESDREHTVRIGPASGAFRGQAAEREWTVTFRGVTEAPRAVSADGESLSPHTYAWSSAQHTLTVELPAHSVRTPVTLTYR
ncbi:TIM-barrel domain-containing protein [Streptomyces sp. NPDC056161]|uniref:TIM-barrel domain-containing protein n=1 Tax=Streptomyces sp. NPDC056161 TaxID=3345732 RepID=UPI0035E2AAEC